MLRLPLRQLLVLQRQWVAMNVRKWGRELSTAGAAVASQTAASKQPHSSFVFSGVQPTGAMHLGNYLGAISNWVALQSKYNQDNLIFNIVDMHALTNTMPPSEEVQCNIRETAIAMLAAGIDPAKSIVYNQSKVSLHAELMWILSCLTPVSWLNRMIQWKEKRAKKSEGDGSLGLFSYPVLMAADILLFKATHVPVGEDQQQHLELASDIANAFNRNYSVDFFPLPAAIHTPVKRVMSLTDGRAKMSKSDPNDKSRINLNDDRDTIYQKIRKAKTDSEKGISFEPERRPEVANLVRIYSALSGLSIEEICNKYATAEKLAFKEDLALIVADKIGPINERMAQLRSMPGYVDKVLEEGAAKARVIADKNWREIKKFVGLL